VVLLACACLAVAPLCAQPAKHTLTNADVKTMVAKGFSDDLTVGAIEANETQFDVSVDALMALKDGGVSDKVIAAMLKAESKRREEARDAKAADPAPAGAVSNSPNSTGSGPAPALAGDPMGMAQQMMSSMGIGGMGGMGGMMGSFSFDPRQLPVVTLSAGEAKSSMRASFSQVAHTETKGGDMGGGGTGAARTLASLGSQALSFAAIGGAGMMAGPAIGLAMGMMGGMGGRHGPPKVTHVWALAGHESGTPIKLQTPRFEVAYGNLLGIDPDHYEPVLLKLVQTGDNWRLVGATKTQMGRESSEALEKITEVRVATRLTKMGRGDLTIEPAAPLEPGEYGLVLRPLNPGKRSKGSMGGPAETNAFFSVWDFSISVPQSAALPAR
jgi:hypothetical protein